MNKHIVMEKSKIRITEEISLDINEAIIFPHQYDGLRTWESGIVFTRYINNHKEQLKDKKILELGCGVGITSIFINNYCTYKELIANDYNQQVLENAQYNLQNNPRPTPSTCPPLQFLNFNWEDYPTHPHLHQQISKCDIILASDILFEGGPLASVKQLVDDCLLPQGQFWVQVASQRSRLKPFVQLMLQGDRYFMQEQPLGQQLCYTLSPILDSLQSQYRFPGIQALQFTVLIFHKLY